MGSLTAERMGFGQCGWCRNEEDLMNVDGDWVCENCENRGVDMKRMEFAMEIGEDTDFGICDECGEYMEDLVPREGEWLCEECERFV